MGYFTPGSACVAINVWLRAKLTFIRAIGTHEADRFTEASTSNAVQAATSSKNPVLAESNRGGFCSADLRKSVAALCLAYVVDKLCSRYPPSAS